MKKLTILFFVLLFAGTVFAQDKKLYVSIGPGVGLATSRSYDLWTEPGPKVAPVGLGTGLNINLRAGYCMSSILAIELGVVYRMGFGTKFDIIEDYSPEKATFNAGTIKFKSNMLQLVPAFVISPFDEEGSMRPYARVGLIVGLMPSIIETADYKDYSGTYNDKFIWKYYGGIAFGGSAAIGCDFDLSDLLSIYAEIYFNAISYTPTKGKYVKYETNGVDQLPDMDRIYKETEYVKDLTDYNNGNQPDDAPYQTLRNSYPLNNAGLNLGVKIRL